MLITNKLHCEIKSNIDISYFKKLGYNVKIGDFLDISIDKISLGSHKLVEAKCFNCGKIKNVMYYAYNKTTNNGSKNYYCNNKVCINKKREISNYEKYGVNNIFKLKNIKEKIKKTNLKKYGVENPQQNKEINKKTKKTILDRYGVENVFQSNIIKEKIKNTNLKKYGVEYPQQSKTIRSKYSSLHKPSKIELSLLNFIESIYNGIIIKNSKKIIEGYELDIYIPEFNLAIEFNGLYWHNELHKDKNYHINKTELCEKIGIKLLHVWEDDWEFKSEIVKSIIRNNLKIYENKILAIRCQVKTIGSKEYKYFLLKNYIYDYKNSDIKLGLFYNNDIVSVMGFDKNNNKVYKIVVFCDKINNNIQGSFNNLFKYFIKKYDYNEILSYVDRSYFKGGDYLKTGFKFIKKTKPKHFYIINRKRRLRNDIISEKKIYKIYNSGSLKFKHFN